MKAALRYSFLPKNKLLVSHVDECINLLDDMHKTKKSTESPLLLWRTLFKYQKYFTPSGTSNEYSPYSFPGPNYVYLSFATSLEKYQVYEKYKTTEIFPMQFSPIGALSYCQTFEKMTNSPPKGCVGGFSFNPKETGGFLTFAFEENLFLKNLMESVNVESLIVYLFQNKFENDEEMIESLSKNRDFYFQQKSIKVSLMIPAIRLLEFPMFAIDLSESMTAISGSILIVNEFNLKDRVVNFSELLRESVEKEKSLILWFEHDENGNPLYLTPQVCGDLLHKLTVIQNYNQTLIKEMKEKIKVVRE
jgi:hypothetical protein